VRLFVREHYNSYGNSQLGQAAVLAMEHFIACYGIPEQVQPQNGVVFTSRYTLRRRASQAQEPARFLDSSRIATRWNIT
jgi:hypothetical protein